MIMTGLDAKSHVVQLVVFVDPASFFVCKKITDNTKNFTKIEYKAISLTDVKNLIGIYFALS